jgi:DnaJ-class molecular chaperone
MVTCPNCQGRGWVQETQVNEEDDGVIYVQVTCPECHGTGMIEEPIRT